jgi:cytochrome c-type biogenesis protein CcmH/NrfG
VAPGLLPRKAPSAVPAPAEGAATAKAASTAAAVHVRGAKQAMQYGLWKLAADSYRKALALGADTPEVKAGLGICLVSSDSGMRGYQEAVVVLRQALAQDEGNARAWLSLGMAYQFLGNNPEAVVAYKRYLALQPNGKSATEVRAMLERL